MSSANKDLNLIEIQCENALNKLKRRIPYAWDLNIYRGCRHGCKYCYALYSHKYLNDKNFFNHIYVKTNIVERLESELRKSSWKREVVNIGSVTDSYQKIEEHYQIMPEILKLLIKYKTPAIISTKSDLIIRDYELIDRLSQITYINIATTITTTDDNIKNKLEPNARSVSDRFKILETFRKTNASVGLHIMPIIPYLTDDADNVENLLYNASKANVHYILPGALYLRGETKNVFLNFMKQEFPEKYPLIYQLYKTGSAGKEYKDSFYKMFNSIKQKYGLSSNYSIVIKEKLKQNTLF